MQKYLSICFSSEVAYTAIKIALVVGTILALINHSPAIFSGNLSKQSIIQILLTYLVPYCVSTYSSLKVILNRQDS